MFVKNDSFWLYVEYGGKIVIDVGDFEWSKFFEINGMYWLFNGVRKWIEKIWIVVWLECLKFILWMWDFCG